MKRQSTLIIGEISPETGISELGLTRIFNKNRIPYDDQGRVLVKDIILALSKIQEDTPSASSRNSSLKFDLIKKIERETEYKFLDNAQTRSALCLFRSTSDPENTLKVLLYVCGNKNRFGQVSFRISHLNNEDVKFVALIVAPWKEAFLFTPEEIKEKKEPDNEGRVTVSFKTRISKEFEFENRLGLLKAALKRP